MSVRPESNPASPGLLDRLLGLATKVMPGEGASALLLGINVFMLLAAYYLLKPVRESLILVESGAEIKSYAAAGQALLLLLIVPAYGRLASRVDRVKLITWVFLFFASNLVLFYAAGQSGAREGIAFYLWLGVFNNFVVAQIWAFANDVYTEEQGKRLFPVIGVGASLGAWVGSKVAEKVFSALGPYNLMLAAAAVLVLCVLLTRVVNAREVRSSEHQKKIAEKPLSSAGGFALILKSRYLLLIAALILLLNVVNTSGEFLLGKLVQQEAMSQIADPAARKAMVGTFYAEFYSWVNLIGFLIQVFLTSRIVRFLGVGGSLFLLPIISLTGYGFLLFYPVLQIVRIAKILENATDYSLQNTLRHALFLPTSREAKYKAKSAIDTFVVRIGDMAQAGIVFVGTALSFTIRNFATVTVVLTFCWLVLAYLLYRAYGKTTPETA